MLKSECNMELTELAHTCREHSDGNKEQNIPPSVASRNMAVKCKDKVY